MAQFEANPDQPAATPSFPTEERVKLLLVNDQMVMAKAVRRALIQHPEIEFQDALEKWGAPRIAHPDLP
jgi:predicted trehalose synthase